MSSVHVLVVDTSKNGNINYVYRILQEMSIYINVVMNKFDKRRIY